MPLSNTFVQYLREYSRLYPKKSFLMDDKESLTAGRVLFSCLSLATLFQSFGINSKSHVAFRATRSTDTIMILLALQYLGAATLLCDPHNPLDIFLLNLTSGFPVDYQISNETSSSEITAKGGWVLRDSKCLHPFDVEANYLKSILPDEANDPEAGTLLILTSGTTGESKIVVTSQAAFLSNSLESREIGWCLAEDVALGILPFHHVFGLALLSTALVSGYSIVIPLKTDTPSIFSAIERFSITRMNGVPSLYRAMAMDPERSRFDLTSLRTGFIGGGPCGADEFQFLEKKLDMRLLPVYGMSECVGISCGSFQDDSVLRSSGVGRIYPNHDCQILQEDKTACSLGQEGEIFVKGASLMKGYWGEKTPFDEEGYFATGDLGYLDGKGILHLTGRKKEIIIRNGLKISSAKIEKVLLAIPTVQEAAVIAKKDERVGEYPLAIVALKKGEKEDGEALKKTLALSLYKYEVPPTIIFLPSLPHTSSAKIDKKALRERYGYGQ